MYQDWFEKYKEITGTVIDNFENSKRSLDKTADKMFEELGYEKDDTPLDFYGDKKIPYIRYKDEHSYKVISFQLEDKFISMSCVNKEFDKVLKAINEKCKELGWLDKE